MTRWKRAALNSCLLLFSLILAFGLFALGDRMYSEHVLRQDARSLAHTNCLVQQHPTRHHALLPRCDGRDHWGDSVFPVYTNNLGLRDSHIRDVPPDPAPRARVLFLGDSYTYGYNPWEETFVGMISEKFPDLDVLNAGVASYSPSLYYETFRDLLAQGVHIDEVILFLDLSDIQDEASYYIDTIDGKVSTRNVTYRHQDARYTVFRDNIRSRWRLTHGLYCQIEAVLVKMGVYWLPRKLFENVFDTSRVAWTYRESPDDLYMPDGYAPLGVRGGLLKAAEKMDKIFTLARERGIPLSVAVYPWPGQLVHDTAESLQVTSWRAWCEGKCKRFFNLFPPMFAQVRRCPQLFPGCWYGQLYIFGDFHFNVQGNALIAEHVAEQLSRNPVTKAPKKLAAIP